MILKGQYEKKSDEELIRLIRDGEQTIIDYLMEKYKKLVMQKARTLYLIGGDKDDLIQEGMIGLYKAIRDYKEDKDSTFYSFAELCISRQIYSAIKSSNRKKNIPLNTYISLNTPLYYDNSELEEKPFLVDSLIHKNERNPEELFIDKESANMLEYELERQLSKFEKEVVKLYLSGLKYVQIANVLEKEPKSIDNALQRIRTKLYKVMKEI